MTKDLQFRPVQRVRASKLRWLALLVLLAGPERGFTADPAVDLTKYDPGCGVEVRVADGLVQASWPADGRRCTAAFSTQKDRPLLQKVTVDGKLLGKDLQPVYQITTGARLQKPDAPYIFFDRPFAGKNGPVERHTATLQTESVRVTSAGRRAALHFGPVTAGPFAGELVVRLYAGSPLLHIEAALANRAKNLAYCYDALLDGEFSRFAWKSAHDEFLRAPAAGEVRPLRVRHRTIMAENDAGTLAVFAPPHAYFFPRDHSTNFGFVQAGKGRMGLRAVADDPAPYVPWVDAPAGKTQHMGVFALLSPEPAEPTLERVKRYTHGDTFVPLAGHITFTSHWHVRLTVSEPSRPRAPELKRVMTRLGVNVFHLAEFHGDGHPRDTGKVRLEELRRMFELCRRYSDERFLLLPGEEANAFIPGHWLYLFPKAAYLTLAPIKDAPFVEEVPPYGKVYHPQDEAGMARVLQTEGALAWTAHPRIKASEGCPDRYRHKDWYQSATWLGGTWKAMPADLSDVRLGVRSLNLLDDMNRWGQRKYIVGEVDTFELDDTHENYGHMNVNYLRLAKVPSFDDWSPVLEVLRRGEFFVTTGEVLIHSCRAREGKIEADLEWTFPLEQVVLVTSDGQRVRLRRESLPETTEFGRQSLVWPAELGEARWFRLEAWDVAGNGAFTQPIEVR